MMGSGCTAGFLWGADCRICPKHPAYNSHLSQGQNKHKLSRLEFELGSLIPFSVRLTVKRNVPPQFLLYTFLKSLRLIFCNIF